MSAKKKFLLIEYRPGETKEFTTYAMNIYGIKLLNKQLLNYKKQNMVVLNPDDLDQECNLNMWANDNGLVTYVEIKG